MEIASAKDSIHSIGGFYHPRQKWLSQPSRCTYNGTLQANRFTAPQRVPVAFTFKDLSTLGELRVILLYALPTDGTIIAANTAAIFISLQIRVANCAAVYMPMHLLITQSLQVNGSRMESHAPSLVDPLH